MNKKRARKMLVLWGFLAIACIAATIYLALYIGGLYTLMGAGYVLICALWIFIYSLPFWVKAKEERKRKE